jgi:hypothetical protein
MIPKPTVSPTPKIASLGSAVKTVPRMLYGGMGVWGHVGRHEDEDEGEDGGGDGGGDGDGDLSGSGDKEG